MKERQRWQPEEDELLRGYVNQYGPKQWTLISKRIPKTLHRDPKSCLERWKNYLKPGIKNGSLTLDEQNLVVSLQSKYGNKWKKIAAEVPGRTAKRLGKWWEVYKEKQLKQKAQHRPYYADPPSVSAVSFGGSPAKALEGKYDHILETFAEKYVHPKLFSFQSLPLPVNLSLPEPPPVLSLGPEPISEPINSSVLPPWMSASAMAMNTGSTTSSLSSPSSTPSPSVPSEPVVLDPVRSDPEMSRLFSSVQQLGTLIQYCKELDEARQKWVQHKKESTWRLNRVEQQLESEKGRKRREKMEEMEGKIRCLREEEMGFNGRIESEYREQLSELERDAERKETKLMEAWWGKHVKLVSTVLMGPIPIQAVP